MEKELLRKIKELCEAVKESNSKDSSTNPYAMGRVITAEEILILIKNFNS